MHHVRPGDRGGKYNTLKNLCRFIRFQDYTTHCLRIPEMLCICMLKGGHGGNGVDQRFPEGELLPLAPTHVQPVFFYSMCVSVSMHVYYVQASSWLCNICMIVFVSPLVQTQRLFYCECVAIFKNVYPERPH